MLNKLIRLVAITFGARQLALSRKTSSRSGFACR
jgi:hypothetical protein